MLERPRDLQVLAPTAKARRTVAAGSHWSFPGALCAYPDLSLKAARDAANRTKFHIKSGQDLNREKRRIREVTVVEQGKAALRAIVLEYRQWFAAS